MLTPSYARLPTFSAVIGGLAAGLGLKQTKEKGNNKVAHVAHVPLADRRSYGIRIDAYSGKGGLQDQIVNLLAGSDEAFRSLVQQRLLDIETELTNARAMPLLTEAKEVEGLQCFIKVWVAPWIAQMLSDAHQQTGSVLNRALQLLDLYATGKTTSYMDTWRAAVVGQIPEGKAPDFRVTLSKLDRHSRRKNRSIEDDIEYLSNEMESGSSSDPKLNAVVEEVRGLYLAGMATMRLLDMAKDILPEQDILALVVKELRPRVDGNGDFPDEAQNPRKRYWDCFDRALSDEYDRLCEQLDDQDEVDFEKLRADSSTVDPSGLLEFAIDYAEGRWHLSHDRCILAEQCLRRVVNKAESRQLGEIAAEAASILIALRLAEAQSLKFEELNPLMRVRIDNMQQLIEPHTANIPTPFSDSSHRPHRTMPNVYDSDAMASLESLIAEVRKTRPKPINERERKRPDIVSTSIKPYQVLRDNMPQLIELPPANIATPSSDCSQRSHFYDTHLMKCVAFFNKEICALGVSSICNPLQLFDSSLESLIAKSRKTCPKPMNERERERPAIVGTSIKPYQVLRDYDYYRTAFSGLYPSYLPGMYAYMQLTDPDKLRLLRFVDEKKFEVDLKRHGLYPWLHPDDVP